MAYLYQAIMNVPGLSGTAYQRQQQLYQKLGSPKGAYTGSYNQNIWLLGQVNAGNYGLPKPKPAPAPTPPRAPAVTAASAAAQLVAAQKKLALEQLDTFKKLFVDDPLQVDSALTEQARRAATEKFTPEYARRMQEFTSDIGIKLDSFESQQKLINELKGASKGQAGQSQVAYEQARKAANEGLGSAGAIFGGEAQSILGQGEVQRGAQLQNVSTNLMRQNTEFNKSFQETLGAQTLRETNKGLAQQAIPRLTTYLERYPGQDIGNQAQTLINQFTPYLQGGNVQLPQPFDLSRNVGL